MAQSQVTIKVVRREPIILDLFDATYRHNRESKSRRSDWFINRDAPTTRGFRLDSVHVSTRPASLYAIHVRCLLSFRPWPVPLREGLVVRAQRNGHIQVLNQNGHERWGRYGDRFHKANDVHGYDASVPAVVREKSLVDYVMSQLSALAPLTTPMTGASIYCWNDGVILSADAPLYTCPAPGYGAVHTAAGGNWAYSHPATSGPPDLRVLHKRASILYYSSLYSLELNRVLLPLLPRTEALQGEVERAAGAHGRYRRGVGVPCVALGVFR
jgi:hypothetical protein